MKDTEQLRAEREDREAEQRDRVEDVYYEAGFDLRDFIRSLLSSDRERVRAGVEKLAAYESYRAEGDLDPLISKRDVLALLTTPQQ